MFSLLNAPETSTDDFTPASSNCRCSTGVRSRSTLTCCWSVAKPSAVTLSSAAPSGTSVMANSPFESDRTVFEPNVTMAFSSGRCCGSCTIPRTVPKVCALSNADKINAQLHRMEISFLISSNVDGEFRCWKEEDVQTVGRRAERKESSPSTPLRSMEQAQVQHTHS